MFIREIISGKKPVGVTNSLDAEECVLMFYIRIACSTDISPIWLGMFKTLFMGSELHGLV